MEQTEMHFQKQLRELGTIFNNPETYENQIYKFKAIYKDLEIGDFDEDVIKDLTANGIGNIITKYQLDAEDQIQASGIKSKSMKALLLTSTEETLGLFTAAYHEFVNAPSIERDRIQKEKVLKKALVMKGLGLQKNYGHSTNPNDPFKHLEIGNKSWIATECGKSWPFRYNGAITIRPGHEEYYYYAKCPIEIGAEASLELHHQAMPNTPTNYMILVKSGSYDEINF
jgi:hypothetical protein